MLAGGFCKSLGLWHCHDPAAGPDAIHTPLLTPLPLGLVEIRRGDEQLMLFQHHENGVFSVHGYHEIARPVAWL